ncbi:MAG TPA: hypothetical protein DEF45_03975 [Rhodopirellula sp.]|nr:MAG: hypothetical protein CBD74_08475 [Saprospirales bacterium TMED214]HBV62160.1 hypothetical protein [Rhodopirellula sp.]
MSVVSTKPKCGEIVFFGSDQVQSPTGHNHDGYNIPPLPLLTEAHRTQLHRQHRTADDSTSFHYIQAELPPRQEDRR